PVLLVAIGLADPLLTIYVWLIVGEQQILVLDEERLHEGPEQLAVAVRKLSGVDEVDRLVQLRVVLVDGARAMAGGFCRRDLGSGQTEQEEVLRADGLADFDIGAVQRSDGQRA